MKRLTLQKCGEGIRHKGDGDDTNNDDDDDIFIDLRNRGNKIC